MPPVKFKSKRSFKLEIKSPLLLMKIETFRNDVMVKIDRALKIRNDEEAVRRILREIKEMLK